MAILGQVGDPCLHRRRRGGERDGSAAEPDRASIAVVDPEQDPRDLRPARSDEAGEPDDLAGPDREPDVAEDADPGQPSTSSRTSPIGVSTLGNSVTARPTM